MPRHPPLASSARPPPAASRPSTPDRGDRLARTALRRDPHARGARVPRRAARPIRAHAARAARGSPADPGRRGERPRPEVPARDRVDPQRPVVARRRHGAGPRGPACRDHRPDRPQDGDQRAELGREGLARRPGGCHEPHLGERDRGAADAPRLPARHARVHEPRGQGVPGHRGRDADHRDASARLAPRGEAPEVPRPRRPWDARVGLARRLRAVLLPQREGAHRGRARAVLLPAEARVAPRGEAVERHLRARAGRARDPAGHRARDRAHRDDPGRVPDGRDPLRAARPLLGPQRRALGLHLLDREDVPLAWSPLGDARPQRRSP